MAKHFYGGTYIFVSYLCGTNFEKFENPWSKKLNVILKKKMISRFISSTDKWFTFKFDTLINVGLPYYQNLLGDQSVLCQLIVAKQEITTSKLYKYSIHPIKHLTFFFKFFPQFYT